MIRIHPGNKFKKEFRLDSNDCGFICAGVNKKQNKTKTKNKKNGGYEWHALFYLSCVLQTYYCSSSNKKLLVSWQFYGTCVVTQYGSSWRNVVNQSLEFDTHYAGKSVCWARPLSQWCDTEKSDTVY